MRMLIDVPEKSLIAATLFFIGLSYTPSKPYQWGDDNEKNCTEKDQPDNKAFP